MGEEAAPPPVPTPRDPPPGRRWPLAGRVLFRFAFVYLTLYILPFPAGPLTSLVNDLREIVTGEEPETSTPPVLVRWVIRPYSDFMDGVVVRTGQDVFGVEIQYRPRGSGDTTWNYVQVFDFLVAAAALALVWSAAAWGWGRLTGRRRPAYPVLHEWLRVYVRFYLAYQMVVYGAMKVIKLQFAFPGPDGLLQTFGESSPMRMLWTFMGASDGYTWFTGAGELVAGLLLTTRRTTLLGALVTFGVMAHVAALNFCYDVPVKLFSSHLVLMSLFLMAPDLPWLTRALILGRPAAARGYTPLVRRRWLDWTLFAVRSVVVLTFLGVTLYGNNEASKLYGRQAPEPPLYGLWEVERFDLDGETRPPLLTDAGRWQRVVFRKGVTFSKKMPGKPAVLATNMLGKVSVYGEVAVDQAARTITLTQPGGPPGSGRPPAVHTLRYTEPEPGMIVVEGELPLFADGRFGPRKVRARLRHYGPDKFLLASRGFHWVNEVPYNQFGPRTEPPPPIPPPPKRP